jgi:hypothetical protein
MKKAYMAIVALVLAASVCVGLTMLPRGGESRVLSEWEMRSTVGAAATCDCYTEESRVDDECKDDDTTGCAISTCYNIRVGTGNSRTVCKSDASKNDGVCTQKPSEDDIICYRTYKGTAGESQSQMDCSAVSGNCISGPFVCVECTDVTEDGSPHKLPQYYCKKAGGS